jgi:SAM-dependent methyltransferase
VQKQLVKEFWEAAACGEDLFLSSADRSGYECQARIRYANEPHLPGFARFEESAGKVVLEIGVGLGSDHQRFAEAGADLFGIDLTERAVQHTRNRFAAFSLPAALATADAEQLGFRDEVFDVVFSWGVLHHTPHPERGIAEVLRVLKPGGIARVMIYHKWSIVGLMLWTRYGLLRLKPWTGLSDIYARYLESPGTKAFTVSEARALFSGFRDVKVQTILSYGDLLESGSGQRHGGPMLTLARKVWPRAFIKKVLPGMGLAMLIDARKPN